ncbi:ABC transporter substrate-binding protein [Marinilactibacillus kalidii]|uniref:ABC transporter substrate-binding protein n=1 Tax=Marinilactibacillus kalidii TaxID=2820274 RepID=UPI001ABEDAC5|nr:ABC transporter substrate-binding protein [Marinilactibacillus kalidii]
MNKKLQLLGVSLLSTAVLAACGSDESGEGKQELVISTFGLSEDVMQEDIFAPFEEEHNVDIVVETGTSSERYTKFASNNNSSIDILDISQSNAAKGVEEGLFETLDATKVPNMDNLISSAKELSADGSGPAYTVNSIGIIYDEEAAGMKIEEWSDLWDPALEGKISVPDISTTFGPAMLHVASDYKGVDIKEDDGAAALEGIQELAPNIVKTYSKSSDLVNMFNSGEIVAAVVGDFAVPIISESNTAVQYMVPESGTYGNFNTVNVNANTENKELAYAFIDWRISQELQEVTAESLNEAPTNENVELSEAVAANKTYGDIAERTQPIDYTYVNAHLEDWINEWNRTINQ